MFLSKPILTHQRSMLNWLFPVICFLCTNSILAVGTNPQVHCEKISLSESEAIIIPAYTIDYGTLSQEELKQELKKLKKRDRELYKKIKSEFLKPNVILQVVAIIITTLAASLLGVLAGCLIYSMEP